MSTTDQSILEMTTELVRAQIQAGNIVPEEMQQVLADTHAQLMGLQARGNQDRVGVSPVTGRLPLPSDWRDSITQHVIQCLECGRPFRQLSRRHLGEHDMNARSYRIKYGIPKTIPLAAKETTARRRIAVQATRPWEKTPRYIKMKAAAAKQER